MTTAYTFEKRKDTNEIHIFEGTYERFKVTYKQNLTSICGGKVRKATDKIENADCLSEDTTRRIAAEKGRSVCGNCIRHLYSTYDK